MRLLLHLAMEGRDDVQLVAEAADGEQTIDLVAALRPDLLVLDVEMPVLDGLSALPRLRSVSPDTRVVMFSALDSPQNRARAASSGATAYVQKGAAISDLVDELLRAGDLLDAVLDTLLPSTSHLDLPNDATGPSRARRFVTDTLTSWGTSELLSTVELLVSELVTNVVLHTSTAPEVSVRLLGDRVHVEVADADATPPAPRDAGPAATNGRGMALVDALSVAWGWTPTASGKVVWFDVAR